MMERDQAALLRHFEVERELADRLRAAAPEGRVELYRAVYDELFRRVPDHPQNARKRDEAMQRDATERQLRLLRPFLRPDAVYLEIGPGDCHLARTIAGQVRQVYAVDVSEIIAGADDRPANFTLIISDGIRVDVPPGSVHVAYSNQLMEHLHPDDAARQLGDIYQALAPGGVYLCSTPHRFTGPHDISGYFGDEVRGFHLKEYTYGELRALFRQAGFAATSQWVPLKGRFVRMPGGVVRGLEAALDGRSRRLQKRWSRSAPLRPFFTNMVVVGHKARSNSAPAT
jgi:SAM-dependent methyltransferase